MSRPMLADRGDAIRSSGTRGQLGQAGHGLRVPGLQIEQAGASVNLENGPPTRRG